MYPLFTLDSNTAQNLPSRKYLNSHFQKENICLLSFLTLSSMLCACRLKCPYNASRRRQGQETVRRQYPPPLSLTLPTQISNVPTTTICVRIKMSFFLSLSSCSHAQLNMNDLMTPAPIFGLSCLLVLCLLSTVIVIFLSSSLRQG